jgi:alkylation response protein AidB-like acyl-CoA dehydrogenase
MTFATDTAITTGELGPTAGRAPPNIAEDVLLTRADVASALTESGFPVSAATLATKAVRGGGPPYQLFGRKPLYRWGAALDWAHARLSRPVTNTSESRAA